MINYLKGEIAYKDNKSLIIENQGIGFKVFCAPETLKKVAVDQEVQIFTHLHLKEDAAELYGFLSHEELGLFETLNGISGIGPKTAMMLASLGPLEKLKETMEKGKLPPEIKGIGQKKMQKILLELTGKIKQYAVSATDSAPDDALDALVSLGFSKQRAVEALSQVSPEIKNDQERTRAAIKILGSR
jgi:holliday junction DNA helicase RuvA